MSPVDVEIRRVDKDDIYDVFVNGRFKNFFKSFGEAAIYAEKVAHDKVDVLEKFLKMPPKKGKVRRA